jgi:hypothetical protein
MTSTAEIGPYLPAREAALRARLHPDYISRLARESKITSKRIGRRWYIDPSSLEAFLAEQSAEKAAWRQELKEKRRQEYVNLVKEPVEAIKESITENVAPQAHRVIASSVQRTSLFAAPGLNVHAMAYVVHPWADFLHRIAALFAAFVLVFGTYGLIDRQFGIMLGDTLVASASNAAAASAVLAGKSPECDSLVQRGLAAISGAVRSVITSIDNAMPSGLESRSIETTQPCAAPRL